MKSPLRLLIIEDSEDDEQLLLQQLHRSGYAVEHERVETAPAMLDALARGPWDFIVSDYRLPSFSGPAAFALLKERGLDIPLIIISGTIGEELAVEAIKLGVSDYLMKNNLSRLPVAVERELKDAEGRRARREAEAALDESQTRLLLATRASNIGLWDWDTETNQVYFSPEWKAQLGHADDELKNEFAEWESRLHPDDRERTLARVRSFIADPRAGYETEFRLRHKDGSYRWIFTRAQLFSNARGQLTRMMGCHVDITESKLASERLREQAELLNLAREAIIVRDLEDRVIFWNKGAETMYGWLAAEAVGRSIRELYLKDEPAFLEAKAAVLRTGEWRGEKEHVTKDGRKLIVDAHSTLVRDARGNPRSILMIQSDITAQKHLEEQALRTQRLESIGTLASGVAHDLNNILAPILMSASLLRLGLPAKDRDEIVATIEDNSRRGAGIVKQLLTFARGTEGSRQEVQLKHLIRELVGMARQTFPKNIAIVPELPAGPWPVVADSTQMHQILLNLCVNARDAMPEGGTLTIGLENLTLDEHYATMNPDAHPGAYVLLRVKDTGQGIPPEIVDKIFDPFFTTKGPGKGTGLGLSTVIGIVKGHGGFLRVRSKPGAGAVFEIYLPAHPGGVGGEASAAGTALSRGAGELVLIADDEEGIRRATERTLTAHGYRVVMAEDGADGVAKFMEHRQAIKVVLTDIMMPFMDGVAMVRAIQRANGRIPVIAASGMQQEAKAEEMKGLGVTRFLTKPFTAADLLATLHEVLHAEPAKTIAQ
jgi:PAS domain S-box-containing protein